MRRHNPWSMRLLIGVVMLAGCDLPGQPKVADKFVWPDKVVDFTKLYAKNCAGCHGVDGQFGPAPPLNDPVFLAIVSDAELTKVVTEGRKGTSMPAFAKSHGGTLTDEQVQILAKGLRETWGKTAPKGDWPPYVATAQGDKGRGKAVFARACAMCHGEDGSGTPKLGAINDPSFLALISEQGLRRFVITGRRDLGMPNCIEGEGRPLTPADVDDVVAFMMSWKR